MASFTSVSYTTNDGLFQAIGYTTSYENGSVTVVDSGTNSLTATITSAGILTSGALTIQGDIGSGVETLLTGTLSTGPSGPGGAFGYNDAGYDNGVGNIFEFLFTVTNGVPAIVSDFGGLGATGGVILNAYFENGGTAFDGTWMNDFSNDGVSGVSDTFLLTIPEPSSLLLVLFGGALCAVALRATANSRAVPARLQAVRER